MSDTPVSVLITSAGRRNYLVRWFQAASSITGSGVRVVTADSDSAASAMGIGDISAVLPRIDSSNYVAAVLDVCHLHDVQLLVSVNDYEIATLSRTALNQLETAGVIAAVPSSVTLDVVGDKLRTQAVLRDADIAVPETVSAAGFTDSVPSSARQWVVKHRYGSGSSGLFIVDPPMLQHATLLSASTAPSSMGSRPEKPDLALVVIQEKIEGEEYGIDVVCTFDGRFQGVLARKKLRMRSGETDQAITVDPAPFEEVGEELAGVLQLCGNTDVDVIVRPDGTPVVIDINPRFGGGYPFSHMAGANVPACYIAWTLGCEIDPAWLQPEIGVRSSKYTAIRRVSS